ELTFRPVRRLGRIFGLRERQFGALAAGDVPPDPHEADRRHGGVAPQRHRIFDMAPRAVARKQRVLEVLERLAGLEYTLVGVVEKALRGLVEKLAIAVA